MQLTKQQIIANNILLARELFKTEFSPLAQNYDQIKQLIELKLKGHYFDVFDHYQNVQKKQSDKTESKMPMEKEQSIELQIMKNMIAPKSDNVTQTLKKYQKNIAVQEDIKEENNQQVALHKPNRLQMNLAQSTKMGTIRAGNIRKLIKPKWRPPFKLYRVIVGHQGWVRSVAVSPCNTFFATGSVDRTIKFWDLASGELKISLTGHINTVRGVQFSKRHPYLFSCGQDKSVKCWDLEMNKVIRTYHGHLSGVYCLKIHQGLGVLITGGRDSAARIWDIRVRRQIHSLVGHAHTVGSVMTQQFEPYIVTGSHDSFIKMWDIGMGKCVKTLTNHKKAIRAMVEHPSEYTFASASQDNIKVWKCPEGQFLRNISGHHSIIDAMAINQDGVLATGGDDGTLKFWDWASGYNFQDTISQPQPGSIAAQNGIFSLTFDRSGCRLLTGECDKTIKMWKEDETATQQTHPIKQFKMEFDTK